MSPMPETTANARLPLYGGVDVGGTSIKIGLVDDGGQTLGLTRIPTESRRGIPDAMQRVFQCLLKLCEAAHFKFDDVAAIGLGTPGTMDIPAGLILEPPNLPGWRHHPIRADLERVTGRPVAFANDAGAAAYGEFWVGGGREFSSLCLFTLGTGVGGGIIVGDFSIDGAHSHGAEFGHLTIETSPSARTCSCGRLGHLEAYASATAVVDRAKARLGHLRIENEPWDDLSSLTALKIAQAATAGDQLALDLIDETADYLARGITIVAHVVDPAVVLLGGAMNFGGSQSPLGQRFLDRVRQGFQDHAFPVPADRMRIDFATLGGDAGYLGAAGLARLLQRDLASAQLRSPGT